MLRFVPLALFLLLAACGGGEAPGTAPESGPTIKADPSAPAAEPAAEAAPEEAPAAADAPDEAAPTGQPVGELRRASELVASIKPVSDEGKADPKKRETLPLDTSLSRLEWVAIKNGDIEVKGRFTKIAGSLNIDPKDLRTMTGEIGIDPGGIDTGDVARDGSVGKIFFNAAAKTIVHGQINVTSLRPEKTTLAVGEKTRALAHGGVQVGADVISVVVPLELERMSEGRWRLTTLEPLKVGIEELGLSARKAALMKACEHKSIDNLVNATASVIFGEP